MDMRVLAGGTPHHHRIAQVLRLRLEEGTWGQGVTEHALCEEFGVSRTTVRQALGSLKREGLLHSQRGVGTRGVPAARKPRVVRACGDPLHASVNSRPRLISRSLEDAPSSVAAFFDIEPGAPLLRVVRVHDLEGTPLSLVVSYLPASFASNISREDLRGPTHQMLWRLFGLRQKRSVHTLRVARAESDVAAHLSVGLAEPVLRIQSSVYLDDGQPIRWTENSFREDRYEYVADMEWPDPALLTNKVPPKSRRERT